MPLQPLSLIRPGVASTRYKGDPFTRMVPAAPVPDPAGGAGGDQDTGDMIRSCYLSGLGSRSLNFQKTRASTTYARATNQPNSPSIMLPPSVGVVRAG